MRILFVAATQLEISQFVEKLPPAAEQNDYLCRYHYLNLSIDVLITGVGTIATAFFLGRQFGKRHYDLAINAGMAGTFNQSLVPGTVVFVTEDGLEAFGAEDGDGFRSVFELGLTNPDKTPYTNGRLLNRSSGSFIFEKNEVIRELPKVTALTSDTVHGNLQSIARLTSVAAPDIESMEGAAFFYACITEKIPCLQIRAVSNFVEVRDKSKWEIELAIGNLNKVLWEIVTSFV